MQQAVCRRVQPLLAVLPRREPAKMTRLLAPDDSDEPNLKAKRQRKAGNKPANTTSKKAPSRKTPVSRRSKRGTASKKDTGEDVDEVVALLLKPYEELKNPLEADRCSKWLINPRKSTGRKKRNSIRRTMMLRFGSPPRSSSGKGILVAHTCDILLYDSLMRPRYGPDLRIVEHGRNVTRELPLYICPKHAWHRKQGLSSHLPWSRANCPLYWS